MLLKGLHTRTSFSVLCMVTNLDEEAAIDDRRSTEKLSLSRSKDQGRLFVHRRSDFQPGSTQRRQFTSSFSLTILPAYLATYIYWYVDVWDRVVFIP